MGADSKEKIDGACPFLQEMDMEGSRRVVEDNDEIVDQRGNCNCMEVEG